MSFNSVSRFKVVIFFAVSVMLGLSLTLASHARADYIEKFFPAGAGPDNAESGWRITYDILQPGIHGYGPAEVWEIQSVEYMRGRTSTRQPEWVKVLNSLALVEIYVPYDSRDAVFDISGNPSKFVAATNYLPNPSRAPSELRLAGRVVAEMADDHVRWIARSNRIRRGEALDLWSIMDAANYRYVLRYSFCDDGTIRVRLGATGENLLSEAVDQHPGGAHLHVPTWRLQFGLGGEVANSVLVMERRPPSGGDNGEVKHEPFNEGKEGGIGWDPLKFTGLVIKSTLQNKHIPPHYYAYKLVSVRTGSARTNEMSTKNDFWVTRLAPATQELKFVDVPDLVQRRESIEGQAVAIWHTVPLQHIPRTEDFGRTGYLASEGLSITMWAGFDLMPHNLLDKTPFYDPTP